MANTGRNDPCPCGSGTKYKKCCLLRTPLSPAPRTATPPPPTLTWADEDPLDALSNSVVDLVAARRFDEAQAVCQRLLREYPDVIDGLERSALLCAARGDHAAAADFYRQALAFVTHPSRAHDYDDAEFYQQHAEQEARLALTR